MTATGTLSGTGPAAGNRCGLERIAALCVVQAISQLSAAGL
jgi:hypothetical protein